MRKAFIILSLLLIPTIAFARAKDASKESKPVDVQGVIFGHILDSYKWEITTVKGKEISLYLPVVLYSKTSGWHVFSSRKLYFNEDGTKNSTGGYDGFYPAPDGSAHQGKMMEKMSSGVFVRPLDLSITKVVLAMFINITILLLMVMPVAGWYRRHKDGKGVPGKFSECMEMIVMSIEYDVIKPSVGPNYKAFSPYLLTVFFFILINNLMALIPIFPAGVSVTGNIAITFFLAVCSFLCINIFGTRKYWKDIFWPDVPLWLKFPIPLMPIIEIFEIFTKPVALMVRLFANMLSGHLSILVLTCLIFIGYSIGVVLGTSLTVISVGFSIFMNALELLVAFIQAYVFTLLSAVFIGLAQEGAKKNNVER